MFVFGIPAYLGELWMCLSVVCDMYWSWYEKSRKKRVSLGFH